MFWIGIVSLFASALAQETPSAEPTEPTEAQLDRARVLYDNGKNLFDEGAYRDSITAWEESFRLSKRPALLFNIANAHERLAEYDRAIDTLNRYRAFATEEERESIGRRMRNLERLQEEKDAQFAAATPQPTPKPAPAPAPTQVVTAPVAQTPAPAPQQSNGRAIASVGLIGVGVAALGTGVALGLSSKAAAGRLSSYCTEDSLCLIGAEKDLRTNHDMALFSDISFGVGAAAVVGGVLLLVSKPKAKLRMSWSSVEYTGTF